MASLFYTPIWQVLDDNGNPISGAKLYAYEAGTTTPQDVYSDAALSTAISQPVVADSAGRFEDMYLATSDYKFVLKDASDVTIWTQDDYTPPASGSTNLLNGISTEAAARTAIGAASATDVSANTTSLATIESQIAGLPGEALGDMAGEDDVGVDNLASNFGYIIRNRYTYTNSANTSLSSIPEDTSIPQKTEGTEVFNEDLTPVTSGNKFFASGVVLIETSGGGLGVVTLFWDGASSASRVFALEDVSGRATIYFESEFETASLSAVNLLVRASGDTLNFGTTFGAASISSMTVLEIEDAT